MIVPRSRKQLLDVATGGGQSIFKVNYETYGNGLVEEVTVTNAKMERRLIIMMRI